ncbi:MAG: serine/threonine-protein kinase [Planctomycetota bacterium]
MTETSELRRLFELLMDVELADRGRTLDALDVDEATRSRLRSMIALEDDLARSAAADADGTTHRTYPWPGDHVGAWRLVAPIGDGGMGSVWLGVSRGAPEVRVAIKFAQATGVDPEEAHARLVQERRVLSTLDHHGIATIVDGGSTANDLAYLVLEAIDGRTLDVHSREQSLPPDAIVDLVAQVCDAVAHVHERGIVHRDIKPQNILVRTEGAAVLVDFGAAKISEDADLTASHHTVGAAPRTPAFASPEQERGEVVTPAADVFALGETLAVLLHARRGGTAIDSDLESILDRARNEDPGLRYASASELATALRSWRARTQALPERWQPPVAVRGLIAAGLLAAGAALGAALFTGDQGARGGEIEEALVAAMAGLPALEIPLELTDRQAVAEARNHVDWTIALALGALAAGDVELAAERIAEIDADLASASALRTREFATLCDALGVPGAALGALQRLNLELLEPEERLGVQIQDLVQRARVGLSVGVDSFAAIEDSVLALVEADSDEEIFLARELRESLDEPDGPGAVGAFVRLRAGLGEPVALERLLDDTASAAWRDPSEEATERLAVLLELHLRLRARDAVSSVADEVLAALELELGGRLENPDDQIVTLRTWALARIVRVLGSLETDPRRARDLARAGRAQLEGVGRIPADLDLFLEALGVAASLGAGDQVSVDERDADLAERRRLVFGAESPLYEALERSDDDAEADLPALALPLATDVDSILTIVDRERRLRRSAPWWAP